MKNFYNDAYDSQHYSKYDGGDDYLSSSRASILWKQTEAWLDVSGLLIKRDAKVLEIGCGMATLCKIHPGWFGAEYSLTAVTRVKEREGIDCKIFEEDAQKLSFKNEEFDGIFTWAALEHVPNPDIAFKEIDRVLKRGGQALIAPAWNCRSWTVKKLENRPYSDLPLIEKVEKYLIPVKNNILIRALFSIPQRLILEAQLLIGRKKISLKFKALNPRWDLIEKYGHESDDDAVAQIDLHAGIIFFLSRGYRIISHPTFFSRFFVRHEPLVIQKV